MTATCGRRPGFTLIEMLVVLAIIVVLSGVTAAAVVGFIDVQRRSTTNLTLATVHKALEQHIKAVLDKAEKEPIPDAVLALDSGDVGKARARWKRMRLQQEFPATYNEATTDQTGLPAKSAYKNGLKDKTTTAGNELKESSICLLMALQQNRGVEPLSADTLGYAVANVDGSLKGFVDSWGTPLAFFRPPTNNTALLANTELPVIVSAGQDTRLGLAAGTMKLDTTDPDAADHASDNLYSFRLRLGGSTGG